jgi:hypothetical protein
MTTLAEFNAKVATEVKGLHDALHAAGHPVTPTEAKALWCVGWAAVAKMVKHEEGAEMLIAKARELAAAAEAEGA